MLNIISLSFKNCIIFFEFISLPIATISLIVILFYYFYFFIRIIFYKKKNTRFNQPVSIIICAKNELDNLKKNLPLILEQNYVDFEVVVVNDQSTDESKFFLEKLAKQHENLIIVEIDDFVTHRVGKKFALTLGVKTATHEHLLLTDADCYPNSKDWIKKMCCNFKHSDIILGYGGYEKKNTLLNRIIRFDTFNIAQQYLSFSLNKQTYMGVGRNLAYKKSLFFENKGFASHIHIPSGDDDLFIQEIADKKNVAISIDKFTHTISKTKENWKDWIYQKRRHISTSPLYNTKFKILLSLYPLAQFLFLISIILLLTLNTNILHIIILLSVKWIVSYFVNYKTMKQLHVFDLYWIHPIYEILHLLVQGNFVLLNLFSKPEKWSK